jgi:hypothetical protein
MIGPALQGNVDKVADTLGGSLRVQARPGATVDPAGDAALAVVMAARGARLGLLSRQAVVVVRVDPSDGFGDLALVDILVPMTTTTTAVYRRVAGVAMTAPRHALRSELPARGGLELLFGPSALAARISFARLPDLGVVSGFSKVVKGLRGVQPSYYDRLVPQALILRLAPPD